MQAGKRRGITMLWAGALMCMLSVHHVAAQDLLVTARHDTINCRLGKLTDGQYPIHFVIDGQEYDGMIRQDSVLFFRKNVFRSVTDNRLRPRYPLWQFGIEGGLAHQLGTLYAFDKTTEQAVKDPRSGVNNGWMIGVDVTRFVSRTLGLGLTYNTRRVQKGEVTYRYIGPEATLRFWDGKFHNHAFLMCSAGYGWMNQKDVTYKYVENVYTNDLRTQGFTGIVAAGYNCRLSEYVSLRLKLSWQAGATTTLTVKNLPEAVSANSHPLELDDYCQNMNTLNLSVGFVFNKYH